MKIIGRPTVTPNNPKTFGGASDEQIVKIVANYLKENPPAVNIPDGLATEEYVRQYIQTFAEEIMDSLATKEYVDDKVPQNVATQTYVQSYVGEVVSQVSSGVENIVKQYVEAYINEALGGDY